jgi:predicted amidohydrolase
LLVDPWGQILVDMKDEIGIGFGDVDLGRIAEVRARIPAIDHRRAIGEARPR